ncbi:DUF1338 domain-containing protein [Chitinibacteraceae bacterium HSL-7]
MDTRQFFDALWQDYIALTPQAAHIRALFGPQVVNDHVAFRTADWPGFDLGTMEAPLLALGYRRDAPYHFADKHLDAWSYLPPGDDDPLIFMSALQVDALSPWAAHYVASTLEQAGPPPNGLPRFYCGRPWPAPSWDDYQRLANESEYAAWLMLHGFHANHFTIAVHRLEPPTTLEDVIARVAAAGYPLNTAGGIVKGTPEDLLEQAATLAESRPCVFSGNETHNAPTCYYEFAQRHRQADGALYRGFVTANANRIFESTDRKGDS